MDRINFLKTTVVFRMLLLLAGTYSCATGQPGMLHDDKNHNPPRKHYYAVGIELRPKVNGCEIGIAISRDKTLAPRDLTFKLGPGSYTLNVMCQGFKQYSAKLVIPHDVPPRGAALVVPLERLTTRLTIFTIPPEAEIYLGDFPMKRSGADGLVVMQVEYGHYELRVQKEGYLPNPLRSLDLSSEAHSETIKLYLDISGRDEIALDRALSENRIEDALVLYKKLLSTKTDPSQLHPRLVSIVDKLNQRSTTMVQNLSPDGLKLDAAEVAEMRRWYADSRTLLAFQASESSATYEMFRSLWEVEWMVHELLANPSQRPTLQQKEKILVELANLEASSGLNATLTYEIGCIYRRAGELDSALRAFRNAQAASLNWAYPYYGSGSIHVAQAYQQSRYTKKNLLVAAEELERAIALDAHIIKAYALLVICYADAGQSQRAVDLAEAQARISPDSGQVNFALGYAYFSKGRKHYRIAGSYFRSSLLAIKDSLDIEEKTIVENKLKEMGDKAR